MGESLEQVVREFSKEQLAFGYQMVAEIGRRMEGEVTRLTAELEEREKA